MPKNLYKVQKQITKKKGKLGTLHENSRDSRRLQTAGVREDKLARVGAATNRGRQGYCE
jgi:translation machinery-associated protein 16